jgi:dihydrolipoamide dehydrogenase
MSKNQSLTSEPKNYSKTKGSSKTPTKGLIQEISSIPILMEQEEQMKDQNFDADVIVIGAGPGGYVAAIRAAQLGSKVICVEKKYLGGTCLNVGCIPSKSLIASVDRLNHVKHAEQFGIELGGEPKMNFDKLVARTQKVVTTLRGGIGMLFKKNNVKHVEGAAKFLDSHTIEVTAADGKAQTLKAKNYILATGSSPIYLNIPGLTGASKEGVWTSDDAVNPPFVPKSMIILGGGAVGCEFGFVYNGLGSKVTVVEMMERLVPMFDEDLGSELGKQLTRQGITVKTGATVEKCEKTKNGWKCTLKKGGQIEEVEVEVVLLGVGRKANTEGMNLENIGVRFHKRGIEVVDDTLRTHVSNIYAIGDVIGRIQLAHVASAEGLVVANNIVQQQQKAMDYNAIPNCVYTVPEVASVGLTQGEAEAQGYDVRVGKFNFRGLGKAIASGETEGFVKVVCDKKYGEVLGVHMVGPHVTDMIHEAVVALKLEATIESMIDTIHAHPTMSEAVLEAFEDAGGHAIHKM